MSAGQYIVEFIQQGRYVKVTAIDPVTGVEATIVGDANAPRQKLENVAVKKLTFLLGKHQNQ